MNIFIQHAYPFFIVGFVLYRRIRRSIGFQPFKPKRLIFRIALFTLVALFFISSCFLHPISFIYVLTGAAIGSLLLTYAIKHSQFETRKDELFYRTHIWIESIVLFLFLSRFLFRITLLFQISNKQANMNSLEYSQHFTTDPLTMSVFFILVVYYIGFYLFLIKKGKQIPLQNS